MVFQVQDNLFGVLSISNTPRNWWGPMLVGIYNWYTLNILFGNTCSCPSGDSMLHFSNLKVTNSIKQISLQLKAGDTCGGGRVFLCRDTKGLLCSWCINKKGHPAEKPPLVIKKDTPTRYHVHSISQGFSFHSSVNIVTWQKPVPISKHGKCSLTGLSWQFFVMNFFVW